MTIVVWVVFVVSMMATMIAGITLLVNGGHSKVQRSLGLFLMACALWSTASVLQSYVWSFVVGEILVRLTFIAGLTMAYLMYRFSGELAGVKRKVADGALLLATLAAIGLSTTPYVISGVFVRGGATIPIRQPLYLLVVSLLVILLIVSVATVLRYYNSLETSKVKLRIQLVAMGLIVGIVIGSLTNIILPNIAPDLHAARMAWLPSVLWTLTLLYAVVRHGFLDIRMAIVRGGGFVLSAIVAASLYSLTVLAVSYWFGILGNYGTEEVLINSILIVVFAALFSPLKQFFDRFTNIVFGRANYSRSTIYTQLTSKLVRVDTIDKLRDTVRNVIASSLRPRVVDVHMIGDTGHAMTGRVRFTAAEEEAILARLASSDVNYIEFDPYDEPDDTTRAAQKHRLALIYPLYGAKEIVALFCLGPLEGRLYGNIDREFLQTIADELSITTEKLLSVEQIRDFNEGLQRKISRATKELRASNRQLMEMDATKDEFVSMASHQLRTPLTSVKGYISMVLEGDAGDISKSQRQLLREAYTSSERMVHLIGDFLNVSRLQTGKFIIDPHACDLAKIVTQEVDGIRQIAETHSVKLVYKSPPRFPQLYLDEGKIRQVIMNFIDNAIYYSPESKTIKVTLAVEDGDAVLRVIDQGMGVPKDVQSKLFSKFFRAENARKQRPDGTGIGLYLAKKVIDGHHGKPVFESTLGKGSTFGFRLPIKRLAKPPKQPDEPHEITSVEP